MLRRERDRLREEAKAAGRADVEYLHIDDNAIAPGTTLNRLNPWTDLTPQERAPKIAEFRALGDMAATVTGRLSPPGR